MLFHTKDQSDNPNKRINVTEHRDKIKRWNKRGQTNLFVWLCSRSIIDQRERKQQTKTENKIWVYRAENIGQHDK